MIVAPAGDRAFVDMLVQFFPVRVVDLLYSHFSTMVAMVVLGSATCMELQIPLRVAEAILRACS